MLRLNEGVRLYVPLWSDEAESRAWAELESVRAGALIPVAESAPAAAVMVPGVMLRLPTGSVRAVVSTVPAALVGAVALAERVQAAPVPRASVIVHAEDAEPVAACVPVPFRVTPLSVAPEVVAVRLLPETVEFMVSADAGKTDAARKTPAAAVMPRILVNLRMKKYSLSNWIMAGTIAGDPYG